MGEGRRMTEELSKGFTGIEINGVRFSNIKEMLIYMNKQRVRIINLENENAELKEKLKPENCLKLLAKEDYIKFSSEQLTYAKTIIQDLLDNADEYARQRAEDFLKENK